VGGEVRGAFTIGRGGFFVNLSHAFPGSKLAARRYSKRLTLPAQHDSR
jgi:hypothetical protein